MSSVHVLVVEDEADVRELLSLHLKREGYTVAGFEDAEEALTEFSKTKFDLIVLDWMLPKMSGLDFCKRVRTQFASQVPVMPSPRAPTPWIKFWASKSEQMTI
jgi:DNA-binding response OmpR family regulator